MSKRKKRSGIQAHIIKSTRPVLKAEHPTKLTSSEEAHASEWLQHPVHMAGLKDMVTHSSILPQCIRAYKNNIAGFGIGIRYKEDYPEETAEMKQEWLKAQETIELLNLDMDTKTVFEDIIEARETYGIAYMEIIRNYAGAVTGIEYIEDTPSITKTAALEPYVEAAYNYRERTETRKKKFRKYRQQIGTKTVYFKEFGDPRVMNKADGTYLKPGQMLKAEDQANEIIEFAIGTEPYGEIRWIGQVLGIDGSRKAENLNNRYFEEGRHTPMMIVVKNGTLKEESFSKLQEYMDGVKGENGQHAFLLLETEGADNVVDFGDDKKSPDIEVKDLASILQRDELFQDYLDNNRRKAQSAFQLPDLYVGYTMDFNRATAQTAMEVTEKQVFQPERRSLAWIINHQLLNGYQFQYVEAYFQEPDITNPDDLAKLLNITERAGGLPPNKAKDITYNIMGDKAEPYDGGWGDIPIAFTKLGDSNLK